MLAGVWSVGIVESLLLEVPPLAPLLPALLSVELLSVDAGAWLGAELCALASSCRHFVFASPLSESQVDDGADP